MKKTITFFCFAAFALTMAAQTVNIEGDPHGGNPYANITAAIADAVDGNVILITGVHTEPISISNKSITLRGTDPTVDIIQAAASADTGGTGSRVISLSAFATDPDPLPVLNITIENLGIRYGNYTENGGGIYADKVIGLVTLRNLIITNNYSVKNGGGLSLAGSNAHVIDCTIQNNSSAMDGGGVIAAPSNASGVNSVVNIQQSLIDTNTGRNGGGIYINGNNGFGNDYLIDVTIENSTISNNTATSASSGFGGGAIFSLAQTWTTNAGGDGSSSNLTLKLVHVTTYNNAHAAAAKSGLQFAGGNTTNFSAYNSIIVAADVVATKAINFANTNTTEVKNCIMGGLQNANLTFLDDASRNNKRGYTATAAGLTGTLANNGGGTQTIAIIEKDPDPTIKSADDFCTADTGLTLPTIDQRAYTREGIPDAGAFEFGATLSTENVVLENKAIRVYPNPVKDVLYIKSINTINKAEIYDLTGKRVFQTREIYSNGWDISSLTTGLYTLKVTTDTNISSTKKIVISR